MAAISTPTFDWKALSASSVASVKAELLPQAVDLPALPHAVTEFVQRSASPNFNVAELAAIVEKDSALTVELLKHVNCAIYAMKQPVRSVKDAIVHIGINPARLHLLAVGMKAATRALQTKLINQRNFWNESLQKALFAREIAKRMRLDPNLAFLGGLLQDYILPVLTNTHDKLYLEYLSAAADNPTEDIVDWERRVFGWDHTSAGAYFASFTGIDASGTERGILQAVSRRAGIIAARPAAAITARLSDSCQSRTQLQCSGSADRLQNG